MNRFLRLARSADLRLLVAVTACVVLFVATPTTPTESSGCGGDYGNATFQNTSDWVVRVNVSGPESKSMMIDPEGSGTFTLKVGYYAWKAQASFSGGVVYASAGNVTVKKGATTGVTLTFQDKPGSAGLGLGK
jgi:uncharacterized membrane protein